MTDNDNSVRWTAALGIAGIVSTLVITLLTNRATVDTAKDSNSTALNTAKATIASSEKLAQLAFDQNNFDKYRDRRKLAYVTLLAAANELGNAPEGDDHPILDARVTAARDQVRIVGIESVREPAYDLAQAALDGHGEGDAIYDTARSAFVDAVAAEVESYSVETP